MLARLLATCERAIRSIFHARERGWVPDAVPAEVAERKVEYLREVDILRDLTDEEMAWLKDVTPMVTCEPGRVVYGPGDDSDMLFLLKRGRVRLYRLSPEGKRLEVTTLGPGTFFGEMPLVGQHMHQTVAEVVEQSLICALSRGDLERLIVRKPQVAVRLLEALNARLAASETRLEELAFHAVPARIAATLLRLADGDVVRISHRELAELTGTYRETVTKTLDEFKREGLVELDRRHITLRDRERLAQIAGL